MRARTFFLVGLVLGGFLALTSIVGGTFALLPWAFVWTWLLVRRPRFATASGGLIGAGAVWYALVGLAALRCADDVTCSVTDVTPVLAFFAALVAAGIILGLVTRRRLVAR
jgi:hypothetical protein